MRCIVDARRSESCPTPATVWARHAWWCTTHVPDTTPDPNCSHSLTSVFDGVEVCAWCCGHLQGAA